MASALLTAMTASDTVPEPPSRKTTEIPRWGPLVRLPHGVMAWNRRGPDEIAHHLDQHLIHCMFTPYRNRETTLGSSKIRSASASPGACEIVPAGVDYWARWHQCKEVVTYAVDSKWLNRIAEDELDLTNPEIEADGLPIADERIVSLTNMLRAEFQACGEDLSDIYADSVLLLLSVHLLRNHSNLASKATRARPVQGIPPKRLAAVTEYMRENLQRRVSLAELASIAGLSPDYFLRAFKTATGTTPHKLLLSLRLDRAQHLLATSLLPVADIAFTAGFSQQSHMTAMMLRERKITPSAYRSAIQHKL
jgi:AraC family transcriptional regulator